MVRLGIMFIAALAMGTGAGVAYTAWPLQSARQIVDALDRGDIAVLNRKVVWPELRASIKDMMIAQINQSFLQDAKAGDDGAVFGHALGTMIGPTFVENVVESFVSPSNFVSLVQNQKRDEQSGRRNIRHSIHGSNFAGPMRFEVRFSTPEETEASMLAVMELRNFEWKLTQILALKPLMTDELRSTLHQSLDVKF